ncbi:MAG: hypothetical protein ACYC6V_05320 [Bacillota bacterium]
MSHFRRRSRTKNPVALAFTAFLAVTALMTMAWAAPVMAAGAPAGSGIAIKTMDIHLEPEYDTTDVLVAYDLGFANTATADYGGKISFHVPKGIKPAGPTNEVHICEAEGTNKHAYCAPYTTETSDDYLTFVWSPSKALKPGVDYPIYIEYYYNPLKVDGDRRDLDFYFHPSYDVGALKLTVMPPLRSTAVTLDPEPKEHGRDSQGFSYVTYRYTDLKPEQPVEVKLSYAKPDARPSVAKTGASLSTGTQAKGGFKDPSFYIVVLLVAAGLGGLLVFGVRGGSSRRSPRRGPGHGGRRPSGRAAAPSAGGRSAASPKRSAGPSPQGDAEKQAARRLLLSGKISEQTYREIVDEIDREKR